MIIIGIIQHFISFLVSYVLQGDNKTEIFSQNIRTFNGTFPIKFHIPLGDNRLFIYNSIQIFNNKTLMGLSFSNVTVNNSVGFNFRRGESCTAPVGPSSRDGKSYENITLTEECEKQKGTIQQLTAKMLGMINTNNRPDRDRYIFVNFSNIKNGKRKFYKKYNWSQVPLYKNVSYDYGSALHYPPTFMGKNNGTVIVPLFNTTGKNNLSVYYSKMLGQQYELSFNDLKIVNRLYSSRFYGMKTGNCKNSGYVRPFYERECLCPNGYAGRYCNETEPNTEGCDNSTLQANEAIQMLTITGVKNCTHLIKSRRNTTIQLIIATVRTEEKIPCYQKMGLEVKYVKDKGATGLCLCGNYTNINIISENNKVLLQYTGLSEGNRVSIHYKIYPQNEAEESKESNFVN